MKKFGEGFLAGFVITIMVLIFVFTICGIAIWLYDEVGGFWTSIIAIPFGVGLIGGLANIMSD